MIDLITGILAFLLVFFSAPFAAHFISSDPGIVGYIKLYAIYLLFSTLEGTTTATLRVLNHFTTLAWLRNLQKITEVLLIFFFLRQGYGITGILVAQSGSIGLDAALKLIIVFKRFPAKLWPAIFNESIFRVKPYFKEVTSLLIQTNIHATLKMINGGAEILLLGVLSSSLQVGYYKLARQIIDLLSRVAEPFYEAIYPQLTSIWEKGRMHRLRKLISQVTWIMVAAILPALAGLILFENLVVFLVSGHYEPEVNPLISIMAVGLAINFSLVWLHPLALISGKALWTNITRFIQAIIWVTGSFLLVPEYGAAGTASLYLITNIVWVLIMLIWVARPVLSGSLPLRESFNE